MSSSDKYPSRNHQNTEALMDDSATEVHHVHNLDHVPSAHTTKSRRLRNLIAFWFLGLSNNFAYVVMLSAAHDILEEETHENNTAEPLSPGSTLSPNVTNGSTYLQCNPIGTGAILLADILPTLIVKITAPLYIEHISYRIKVSLVILFALASFIIVAFAQTVWLSILGVVCASISAGLGEPTFLGLSTFFDRNVVSTWSSGTGGAGVFGALSYAGLTSLGLSPRNTVLIMTVVPVIMGVSYFVVLVKPQRVYGRQEADDTETLLTGKNKVVRGPLSWRQKVNLTKPLLKFMVPLAIVYFAEYFINQGLHELLYFNDVWLSPKEQYRWFQVDYQLGVFISRSSVNVLRINKLWILPILQVVNMVLLLTQVFYRFIPSIWIIFAIILYEGLLGGGAYVNTFYKMSKDIPQVYREYSLSVASIADSAGIAVAGSVAIPVHNKICSLNLRMS